MHNLQPLADLINSDRIASKLVGSKITGFRLDPIEGKKTVMRLTMTTDMPFNPFITMGMLLSIEDVRELFPDSNILNHTEFSLSKITLDVKVTKKGNRV